MLLESIVTKYSLILIHCWLILLLGVDYHYHFVMSRECI